MTARKVRWAAHRADGMPVILGGIIADVDEETGAASINARTATVIPRPHLPAWRFVSEEKVNALLRQPRLPSRP